MGGPRDFREEPLPLPAASPRDPTDRLPPMATG